MLDAADQTLELRRCDVVAHGAVPLRPGEHCGVPREHLAPRGGALAVHVRLCARQVGEHRLQSPVLELEVEGALEEAAQGAVRVRVGGGRVGGLAQPRERIDAQRLHERAHGREVAVDRADPDPGIPRDVVEPQGPHIVPACDLEDALAAAHGIGSRTHASIVAHKRMMYPFRLRSRQTHSASLPAKPPCSNGDTTPS